MTKNKSAILVEMQKIEIGEQKIPEIRDNEVLVKIEYCGVCGSDVEFFAHGCIGTRVVNYPLILGHEASGEIVSIGDNVKNVFVGQKVVVEPGIPCGHCEFCRQGRYNLCNDMRFLSCPPNDGLFSQFVAVPANMVFPLPEGMDKDTRIFAKILDTDITLQNKKVIRVGMLEAENDNSAKLIIKTINLLEYGVKEI